MTQIDRSRLRRAWKLSKLGARVAVAQGRRLVSRDETKVHRELAMAVVAELGKLKGLPMKVGQILSYMDGMVPDEYRDLYRDVLGQLCTQSLPMGAESWRQVITEELGKPPEELFERFNAEPIASASIGQVHEAWLDGTCVCVKVQYPGIAEATLSDLKNIDALMGLMRTMMPNVDTTQMIEDFRVRLAEECDYEREAEHQRRFVELYRDDGCVMVPEVISELSTRRVLTTRRVRGVTLSELLATASQQERDRIGVTLFRFAFEGILHHGFFHADPHPGNFLFRADGDEGRVCVLDYGCVQPVDRGGQRDVALLLTTALDDGDLGPAIETAFGITDVDEETRKVMRELSPRFFEPLTGEQPFQFDREFVGGIMRSAIIAKKSLALRYLARRSRFVMERQGVSFISRSLMGLANIWGTLGPRADFRSIMEQLLTDTALPIRAAECRAG